MDAVSESDTYIETYMKQFKLVDMRECYHSLIEEAEKENMGYKEFLIKLLQAEQQGKKERNREKLRRQANFDSIKTLDEIDYSFNPSLDRGKIDELGKLSFIERNENVIIIGPPGVGKNMIATGIGINACKAGYKVLFINAKDLIDRLYEGMTKGNLEFIVPA